MRLFRLRLFGCRFWFCHSLDHFRCRDGLSASSLDLHRHALLVEDLQFKVDGTALLRRYRRDCRQPWRLVSGQRCCDLDADLRVPREQGRITSLPCRVSQTLEPAQIALTMYSASASNKKTPARVPDRGKVTRQLGSNRDGADSVASGKFKPTAQRVSIGQTKTSARLAS